MVKIIHIALQAAGDNVWEGVAACGAQVSNVGADANKASLHIQHVFIYA